jgi:hypothetical protein
LIYRDQAVQPGTAMTTHDEEVRHLPMPDRPSWYPHPPRKAAFCPLARVALFQKRNAR